jgi:hypothetical protein
MDQLQTRLDALEQQMSTVTRRLHWWRGLACGLAVLAGLTWALPSSKAVDAQSETLAHPLSALPDVLETLEGILRHVKVVTTPDGLTEVVITGANLRIVNGLGTTPTTNGLGNLIVGYNESRIEFGEEDIRTGSHNVVVGPRHNFSRFGGLVVGLQNEISGVFAVVSGGAFNIASGDGASVSGGDLNTASGDRASVSGGENNTASANFTAVSGGAANIASGVWSTVTGGFGNVASGERSAVSGGLNNTASGFAASVSGGRNITQETAFGWSAGSEAEEVVVGNFRSP